VATTAPVGPAVTAWSGPICRRWLLPGWSCRL